MEYLYICATAVTYILFYLGQGSNPNVETIVVGYLPAVKGEVPGRQGISISGAATLAIERINNDTNLLPGIKLKLVWNDTEVLTYR